MGKFEVRECATVLNKLSSELCYLLATWPDAIYQTSLSLILIIYKMGVYYMPTPSASLVLFSRISY